MSSSTETRRVILASFDGLLADLSQHEDMKVRLMSPEYVRPYASEQIDRPMNGR